MKRFLAFKGVYYYPNGGMEDLLGDFDDVHECKDAFNSDIMKEYLYNGCFEEQEWIDYQWSCCWAHIYDTERREIIWSK